MTAVESTAALVRDVYDALERELAEPRKRLARPLT